MMLNYLPLKKFLLVVGQPLLPREETQEENNAIVIEAIISRQVIFFIGSFCKVIDIIFIRLYNGKDKVSL